MGAKRTFSIFLALFGIGGLGYNAIELLWRGRSHWSMTVAGGLCLYILYGIRASLPKANPITRYLLATLTITAVEFLLGCAVNLWLHLGVWDYSGLKGNLFGQVCLLYSFLWFLISIPCDFLCGKLKKSLG
ncbi:MAG: hypothetical protein J6D21_01010 [Clostridia bacterium]|nr:hypothetical protein [Clostridia bacterium]